MIRLLVVAIALSCVSTYVQAQPSPSSPSAQTTNPSGKAASRRPAEQRVPRGKSAPAPSRACGLGVIVSVGDEFMVKKIGLNPFGNDETIVPIESWGLDDLVYARVRAAVPAGIGVHRIPYSKSAFPPPKESGFQLFRDRKAELVDLMRQITRGTDCQRYILVSKSISKIKDSNAHTIRGIGILDWGIPLAHRTFVFALSYIRVFDGRDFSIIRQGSALTEREPALQRILLGELIFGPYSELSGSSFPSEAAKSADNLALREYARALLTASLDKTLPFMLRP